MISDQNAASAYVRFLHPSQWELLDFDDIYAMNWLHPDTITYRRKKGRKCAEVLVPHCVECRFLTGAYVVDAAAGRRLALKFILPVEVNPVLFFR